MSESHSKLVVALAGVTGALFVAAISRKKPRRNNRRHGKDPTPAPLHEPNFETTVGHPMAVHSWPVEGTSTTRVTGKTLQPILLLIQGLSSVLLLSLAPYWRPISVTEEAWRQVVGSFLIAALTSNTLWWYFHGGSWRRSPAPAVTEVQPDIDLFERPERIDAVNGVWIKDKEASDSMDAVCDLMQLNGLLRMAIGLIRGVEIEAARGSHFKLSVISGVLWFKIRESYPLDGTEVRHRRRDFRGGGSFGLARPAVDGGIEIKHRFGPVFEGTMQERFYCPQPDMLMVDTIVDVPERGPAVRYRQIYLKKDT